jgi:hypothetical protein
MFIDKKIAITIFRALSIYSIVKSIEIVAYRLPIISNINDLHYSLLTIIQVIASSLLLVVGAFIIWYLSPIFADSIFKHKVADDEYKFSSNDIHVIIFSAIGMFIIVEALPGIVRIILFYYQIESLSMVDKALIADRNSSLISLILQFILGLWLLLGSHGIINLVRLKRKTE